MCEKLRATRQCSSIKDIFAPDSFSSSQVGLRPSFVTPARRTVILIVAGSALASPEMLLNINLLPHLICSFWASGGIGGYEAGEHDDTGRTCGSHSGPIRVERAVWKRAGSSTSSLRLQSCTASTRKRLLRQGNPRQRSAPRPGTQDL